MQKLYNGKTKDVLCDDDGSYYLLFKDDATGENGVFDPGSNTVGGSVSGKGRIGLVRAALLHCGQHVPPLHHRGRSAL
jgi:phosphoribosylaminoimidazole-succinocarboxamide synthase